MPGQDGDGWARCGRGHRHWGRFGAVGLLAWTWPPEAAPGRAEAGTGRAEAGTGRAEAFRGRPEAGAGRVDGVLLVHRSWWSHHGGTWGPPGGARDSDEVPAAAALRETWEECGLPPDAVEVTGVLCDDHGDWSYQTFLAAADARVSVHAASAEIIEARWVDVAEVTSLPLHPGFAETWPLLREALTQVTIIVDAANVIGSRPDGWWRDRAGAVRRLHGQLVSLSERGLAALPEALALPPLTRWYPGIVLVVEGAARRAGVAGFGQVRVVTAAGSGDDAIVAEAAVLPGRRLVVTADRELRRRCQAAGASVTGPGWLLGLLSAPGASGASGAPGPSGRAGLR